MRRRLPDRVVEKNGAQASGHQTGQREVSTPLGGAYRPAAS
jgi:hypothetical protein